MKENTRSSMLFGKNYHREKIRQKNESLAKGKNWINSAFNEEITKIITEKTISEQRPKGGPGSARQITGE